MLKQYQVTLINSTGEYKPISCIINNNQIDDSDWTLDKNNKKQIQHKGIIKIAQKKYWTTQDLKKYSYTKCKIRAIN